MRKQLRQQTSSTVSRKRISRKRILDFALAMTILVWLSSLPFLHELILDSDGVAFGWVPNLHIEKALTGPDGKVLGYSKYHVFLYFLLVQLYTLIAWLGWFSVSKTKPYRWAILMGVISSAYHIFLILSNSRKTALNDVDLKLYGTAFIAVGLFLLYYYLEKRNQRTLQYALNRFGHRANKIITPKVILFWIAFLILSTGPYFHDIITIRGEGVRDWMPNFGIEQFLTDSEGYVWGFNSYRVFLLTLSLQVFAQIGWAGWLHDSALKLYRPFLIVPVGLSLYQIIIILFDQTGAYLNRPDIKLLMILGVGSVICYFYYFKNKRLDDSLSRAEQTMKHVNKSFKTTK